MVVIPDEVTLFEEDSQIPRKVAEFQEGDDIPELRPYLISFADYNSKECEISELNASRAKCAISALRDIGTKVTTTTDFQRHGIDRIEVKYKGEYKKLFKRLSPDVELKELKLGGGDARIFYYDVEPEKTLYVVAITNSHYETDKVRR